MNGRRIALVCTSCRHGFLLPEDTTRATAEVLAEVGAMVLGITPDGSGHNIVVVDLSMDESLSSAASVN